MNKLNAQAFSLSQNELFYDTYFPPSFLSWEHNAVIDTAFPSLLSRTSQVHYSLLRYLGAKLSNAISLRNIMIGKRTNGCILNLVYQLILYYSTTAIAYAKCNSNYILHSSVVVLSMLFSCIMHTAQTMVQQYK